MNEKSLKDAQTICDKTIGQFDTPKKLNRSNKTIPQNVIEAFEDKNITSELLIKLAKHFPIYRYKTCLTIHGNFNLDSLPRIAGYKSLYQNKNGSIEVNWIAIDFNKKCKITEALRGKDFGRDITSTHYKITKIWQMTEQNFEQIKAEMLEIQSRLQTLDKTKVSFNSNAIIGMSFFGLVGIFNINLHSIASDYLKTFCTTLTGETIEEFTERRTGEKHQQKLENEKYAREKAIRQENERQMQERIIQFAKPIEHFKNANSKTVKVGDILITVTQVRVTKGTAICYRFLKLDEKLPFGRFKTSFALSPTLSSDNLTFKSSTKPLSAKDIRGKIYQ